MSMRTLTILQLTGTFCAYLFVSVGLPAFVFGRKLSGRRAPERFLWYFMAGNFFIMNLVFVLQLLKISHPITLTLGTVLFAVVGRLVVNDTPIKRILEDALIFFRRVTGGQMGHRTAVYNVFRYLRGQLFRFGRWLMHFLVFRFFDCALTAVLLAALWWIYGQNLLSHYGYKVSDIVVHNYWINSMNDNHIFVDGVYPYGFHCVLYYLHAVFGIETFVLLRVFAFVQNVMLNLMLLCVLRMCCKSRYSAYIGAILFVLGNYFRWHTYSRYYATLPQEFGIIFILPAAYFLFAFFEVRGREPEPAPKSKRWGLLFKKRLKFRDFILSLKNLKLRGLMLSLKERIKLFPFIKARLQRLKDWFFSGKKRRHYTDSDSWLALAGFCMSFSMTLAVHFYGTMVAGIFCLGIAGGYVFAIFRKKYFWSIMKAGLLSVTIAVLPMLLAFMGGTPLQGSLRWGMSVITGSSTKEEEKTTTESIELPEDLELPEGVEQGESFTVIYDGQEITVTQDADGGFLVLQSEEQAEQPAHPKLSIGDRLKQLPVRLKTFGRTAWTTVRNSLNANVFSLSETKYIEYMMYSFFVLVVLGFFYQLFDRQFLYGAMLASAGFYMLFMCVMMSARIFGLPSLMDSNRGSIYFSYSTPVGLSILLDGVLYLPFSFFESNAVKFGRHVLHLPFSSFRNKAKKPVRHLLNLLSLVCVFLALYHVVDVGEVRSPGNIGGQEMNEAVVCLTNIIKTEKDFSWTIVSANDELRMGWDYGYHTETITFLEDMEWFEEDTMIRIPTPVVFFFIEKIPIGYNATYANLGQSVSEEGAAQALPESSGIGMYQGEKRWILMSRMYYWAEEFKKSYPYEMEVYMETENFICYRLEQNPYRLYNFAIDYGYNNRYFR